MGQLWAKACILAPIYRKKPIWLLKRRQVNNLLLFWMLVYPWGKNHSTWHGIDGPTEGLSGVFCPEVLARLKISTLSSQLPRIRHATTYA
eukprot:1148432-Pelagomonas_calceolata.AAC.3